MASPHGRDNGLPPASSYVALVDVDPPVADHVLEVLREAGVPAVAQPLAGATGPNRETRPPQRPTDRVHVDRELADRAREVVAVALPSLRGDFHADVARRADADAMRNREVEQAFAAIVASYGVAPSDPGIDSEPPTDPTSTATGLSSRLIRRGEADPSQQEPDPSYWPEDHFVPPVPPPLPEVEPVARLAWFGIVGGPTLLLLAAVLGLSLDRWIVLAALIGFLAGFVTLIARMPDHAPEDQDGDNGAVV